jgi:hypothetical protein
MMLHGIFYHQQEVPKNKTFKFNAAGGVEFQTIETSNSTKIPYTLSNILVTVSSTTYTASNYFAWDNSSYSAYTSGLVKFFVECVDDTLDVQLYDVTNATELGSLTGINSSGVKSFSVTTPVSDASIALRVKNRNRYKPLN